MAVALSNFSETTLFNHSLRGVAYTPPSAIYLQLHTGAPGEDGTSNVLATSPAARQPIAFSAAAARAIVNSADVEFGPYVTDPSAVTYATLWDALTVGNCLAVDASTTVDVTTGGIIVVRASALSLTLGQLSASPLSEISTYLANNLLNLMFRNVAFSVPTGHKLHAYSTSPGLADSGSELSGNGYSAQSIAFGAPTDGVGSNSGTINLGPATGADWAAYSHLAVKDGSANLLLFGALASPFTLAVGQARRWLATELPATFS